MTTKPIACTLSPIDYRARMLSIATLTREALRSVEHRGRTLELTYAPEAIARVRQLIAQERECCAFLTLELHERAYDVQLWVTVPEGAEHVVPELLMELTGQGQSGGC